MDLTPTEQQQQIIDAVEEIVTRNGGITRAQKQLENDEYDSALHKALEEAGYLGVACGPETGALEAAMIVERIACGGGMVAAGATALVFPMVTGEPAPGPVALLREPGTQPFRFGPQAKTLLVLKGDDALRLDLTAGQVRQAGNDHAGWLMGRLNEDALSRGRSLGKGSGAKLRNWWRTALAAEIAGTAKGAVEKTVRYVSERVQFGRPIGSFQAVQHRLSELAVRVEATRWLALVAAYNDANEIDAATAATYATNLAPNILRETHQLHGAMGFTREYPLHIWTMRLPALQRELGGLQGHARDLTGMLAHAGDLRDLRAAIGGAR